MDLRHFMEQCCDRSAAVFQRVLVGSDSWPMNQLRGVPNNVAANLMVGGICMHLVKNGSGSYYLDRDTLMSKVIM